MVLSSSGERAGTTRTRRSSESGAFPLDSHLVKEYRIKFEHFFNARYVPRKVTRIDLNEYLIPFAKALGFTDFHRGPRYLEMTNDQFQTLDNMAYIVVYYNGRNHSLVERRAITACTATAVLFTLGDDQTARYLDIEKKAVYDFNVDVDLIRRTSKEAYGRIMSRFDQYLTCSPITPIRWNKLESRKVAKTPKTEILKETELYGLFKSGELFENPWITRIRAKGLLD